MTDLTNIFPSTYPDMPTWQDIEMMLQEILNRSDSVDTVVSRMEKEESCPYYREALIRCLEERYPSLQKSNKELLGYYSGDCWYPYWPEPKDKFRELINQYQAEQAVHADGRSAALVNRLQTNNDDNGLYIERQLKQLLISTRGLERLFPLESTLSSGWGEEKRQQDYLSNNLDKDNIDNFRPNQLPRATRGTIDQACGHIEKLTNVSAVVQQVKETVTHTVKKIVEDISPTQPIVIHVPVYINSHIHTHNDNNNCNVLQGPMYDTQFTK